MIRPHAHSFLTVVLVSAATVGVADAAPTVRFGDVPDGAFNSSDGHRADLGADGTFDYITFCIEVAEPLSYGTVYEYGISTEIRNRGGDGPLSLENDTGYAIAYIFQTFQDGGEAAIAALSGVGGLSDSQYRELVQRTFWNKLYGGYTTSDINQAKINALWNAAFGKTDSLGNVRVMNVWQDADNMQGGIQDMLIIVPLPSAAGLASVGLLGFAAVRRRRA